MSDLARRGAVELAAAIRRGETSSRELVELQLERIESHAELNAVVTVDADGARARADASDRARRGGPLDGVPITVKDAWATAGIRTTSGTASRRDVVPGRNAVVVERLVDAGAVVIGKTNVPEGITGQETANELFGRTSNPWDRDRTPGGSSGGAAAAVAAGLTPLEIGSDSGGSIRQPAHCCGVYGHVPTQGLVPLRGHLPLVGLDEVGMQIDLMGAGPLARDARDLDVALGILAGPDVEDGRAWRVELPPPRATSLRGARVGVWLDDAVPLSTEVRGALAAAADAVSDAGADVRAVRPFTFGAADDLAFVLWAASTAMSTDDATRVRLQETARQPGDGRAQLRARGELLAHHEWERLDAERRAVSRAWTRAFEEVDVVLCPISPVVALRHDPQPTRVHDVDHRLVRTIDVDGIVRPYLDQLSWNIVVGMAGLPATAAPVGLGAASGMPIGVQIAGPRFGDRTTIAFAAAMADVVGGDMAPPAR